jgi:hypothetical protein
MKNAKASLPAAYPVEKMKASTRARVRNGGHAAGHGTRRTTAIPAPSAESC